MAKQLKALQNVAEEEDQTVFGLSIPKNLAGITHAKLIGEFLVPVFKDDLLLEWHINSEPFAMDPNYVNQPNNPQKGRAMLYAAEDLALDIWGVLTIGYHEVKSFPKEQAEVDGVAMRIVGENYIEYDWKRARKAMVPNHRRVAPDKAAKHDMIDVILSGQPVIVKCAAFTNLALHIFDVLSSPNLVVARQKRDDAINRAGEVTRQYKSALASEDIDTSVIEATVIEEDGEDRAVADLIKTGEQYYAIVEANGEFFQNRKFDPANSNTRKYFARLAQQGYMFQKLPPKR